MNFNHHKMKKKIIFFLFNLSLTTGFAQQSQIFTHQAIQFNQGKDLYSTGKYAASVRCFEDYLKSADPNQVGQIEEAQYYIAANAFELRKKDAVNLLKDYLTLHPYTPFYDQLNYMLGMLGVESKNYPQALTYYVQVKDKRLSQHDKVEYQFSKAYALLQTQKYAEASALFKALKAVDTRYKMSSTYYYAYSEYCQKNYAVALPEFLKLENNPAYSKIVPYYIVQIYYVQKNYDELNTRTEALLKNNPDNKNNAEIYRIAGEIAYRKQNYEKAIGYLKNYEKLFPQVLRNDMYLLGLSYFQIKDYTNAVQYLSKVTTDKDELAENAYLYLGNSYIKLKDYTNARLAYEASLRTNFNTNVREEAMFNYALTTYETTTAFGESVTAFEQFLKEYPESKYADKAYDYLISVYMTTKNYDAAYQSLLKIKSPNSKLLETKQYLLYQLGTQSFAQNELEDAIGNFTLAIKAVPTGKYVAECLYWRAESYYRTGHVNQADTDLRAFFANPNSKTSINLIPANYSLAYAIFSSKKYSEALTWFLKYAEAETNVSSTTYADALNRIGDCYFNARNFAKAQTYYTKAATTSPNTADYALFQSAYVTGLQKDYNGKISKLENLIGKYPKSEYVDDALYEMGRAYLMLENNPKAIATYQRLLEFMPNGATTRKAALEIGMVYFNMKDYDKAITAYKNVISKFPGTDEANTALESLETVYIDTDNVADYMTYTRTLGHGVKSAGASREDSISYIAAERQYMNGNYAKAISGMQNYLTKFCAGGRYCTTAQYYIADSYYRTEDKAASLKAYQALLKITGNQYTEEATIRCAEITYDQKDYSSALTYFKQLETVAQTAENKNISRLGILRCSYFLNDHQTTIRVASEITADPHSSDELKAEASYNRAKAYLALKQYKEAEPELKTLAADTRTENGAEAKFLLANLYFDQGKLSESENEVMDFAKKNTPYQFWLARSFVLLSDVYIKQNNDFQAKQYLLSLQKNYKPADEIQTMITDRLNAISQREKNTIIN